MCSSSTGVNRVPIALCVTDAPALCLKHCLAKNRVSACVLVAGVGTGPSHPTQQSADPFAIVAEAVPQFGRAAPATEQV